MIRSPSGSKRTDTLFPTRRYSDLAEVSRTLSEIRQINESGRPDPVRYAAIERSFENAQESAKKYAEERQDFYTRHGKAQKEFTIALMQEMKTVGQIQVPVTAADRRELHCQTHLAETEACHKIGRATSRER